MKQILLIILIFIHIDFNAQESNCFNLYFNLGASISIPYRSEINRLPDFSNGPIDRYNSNLGYSLDLMASYRFSKSLSICSGLNYCYTKYGIDTKAAIIQFNGYLTNSYLNFPVLIKYATTNPFSIAFGPYLGVFIKAKEEGIRHIDTYKLIDLATDPVIFELDDSNYKVDHNDRYTNIDYGLSMQLDYEFLLIHRFKNLIFTRINYGLTNVHTFETDYNWKNFNVILGIGVKIIN